MPDFSRLVAPRAGLKSEKGRIGAVMDMLTETTPFGNPAMDEGASILGAARLNAAMRAADERVKAARQLPSGEDRRVGLFQARAAREALRSGQTLPPEDIETRVADLLAGVEANPDAPQVEMLTEVLSGKPLGFKSALHGMMSRLGTFP